MYFSISSACRQSICSRKLRKRGKLEQYGQLWDVFEMQNHTQWWIRGGGNVRGEMTQLCRKWNGQRKRLVFFR